MIRFLQRFAPVLALAAVSIASVRIGSTWLVLSHTVDEPAHMVCGLRFLEGGICPYEYAPLPRSVMATGPWLAGAVLPPETNPRLDGLIVLYQHYRLFLTLARLAMLPFFWIACWAIYVWGVRAYGRPAAFLSVFLFTLLPPVLAHAGVATADMALTAFVVAAFVAALIWVHSPHWRESVMLGLALGCAALAKFAAFAFLPAAFGAVLLLYIAARQVSVGGIVAFTREHGRAIGGVFSVAALVFWAGYGLSFGPVPQLPFPMPAPAFFHAIGKIAEMNESGWRGYLLGETSDTGWWYYYPVALGLKTPLPFLLLLLYGAALSVRHWRNAAGASPLAFSVAILTVCLFSQINVGVRHVLPVYAGACLMASVALAQLLDRTPVKSWQPWVVTVLLVWLIGTGIAVHPDYLAYFNELGGARPEEMLVDSDLDWGQDLGRVARRLRQVGAREVHFESFFVADFTRQGFPTIKPIDPLQPAPGWTAVSPTWWKLNRPDIAEASNRSTFWIDEIRPTERVGSMLLFYFPEGGVRKVSR